MSNIWGKSYSKVEENIFFKKTNTPELLCKLEFLILKIIKISKSTGETLNSTAALIKIEAKNK